MCIVSRGGDGDTAGTADIGVTQLVGQRLELVRVEPVVVPQDVVVRGATGALENNQMLSLYTTQREGHRDTGKQRTPQCLLLHRTRSSLLIVYHYIQHKLCLLLL